MSAVCVRALALLAITLVACGDETKVEVGPAPSTTAPVGSATFAPPPKKPTASATTSAAAPALSIDVPSGPLKWADFGGPSIKSELAPGSKAWAVLPVSASFETVKVAVVEVDRVEGDLVVTKQGADKREVFVPAAFTLATKPADALVRGDAVVVAAKGSRAFARVTSMDAGKVKVRFRYAGDIQEIEVNPSEAIELDGTLRFGSVAAYSETKEIGTEKKVIWHSGQFVQTAEDKSWVISSTGKPERVPAASVRPLAVHVAHKAGDKVWVVRNDELAPGQVLTVEDDGLRYKVKLDTGEEASAPFETVTTPIAK
ncbi:MAG: hypothetical protein JNK04_24970 [Myxococcales bacterium]|nr:hypothetical protein [Myxococcales bacterium]